MISGHASNVLHLILPRLFCFMMIEMPRIVSEFIDILCYIGSQTIVFLEVNSEVCFRLTADRRQCRSILLAINSNPDYTRTSSMQCIDLFKRCLHILCMRRCHTLWCNRVICTNGDTSHLNCPGWISLDAYHCYPYVLSVFFKNVELVVARTVTGQPE